MHKKISVLLVFLLLLNGCSNFKAPFQPPTGILYTNIKSPLKINHKITKLNMNKMSSKIHSFQYGWFGLVKGDISITNATIGSMLETADYADYEYKYFLFGLHENLTINTYVKAK